MSYVVELIIAVAVACAGASGKPNAVSSATAATSSGPLAQRRRSSVTNANPSTAMALIRAVSGMPLLT